jgi:hypothetical protein
MEQGESTSGLYILITFLLILVIGTLLYFGGVFGTRTRDADADVDKPGMMLIHTR